MIIEQALNWGNIENHFPTLLGSCIETIKGVMTKLPKQPYTVTAALYDYEDGITIFAIRGIHYSKNNPCWYTIKIKTNELREHMKKFRLISEDEQKERFLEWKKAH